MKFILISVIRGYQKYISPDTGLFWGGYATKHPWCAFYPTCSEYAIEAINKYGPTRGLKLSLLRFLRCHPWQKKHLDPVP